MPNALITGASAGLGLALADLLADQSPRWTLILTARTAERLAVAEAQLRDRADVHIVSGDVGDPVHRRRLFDLIAGLGTLDLLVNNASDLGPSPLPGVAVIDPDRLLTIYRTNVVAPVALFQLARPALERASGVIVNVSSDAATGDWAGWGPYGSSKAALDQLSSVMGAEHPGLRVYAFDPGDMETAMHQAAFPGEDISDRPSPTAVPPAILRLLQERPPSGRYRGGDVLADRDALAEASA